MNKIIIIINNNNNSFWKTEPVQNWNHVVIIKLGMMAGISKLSLMHIKWVLIINKKSKVIGGKLINSVLKKQAN